MTPTPSASRPSAPLAPPALAPLSALLALSLTGCLEGPPAGLQGPAGSLALDVAALALEGVEEALWDLRVRNGAASSATVFAARLASTRYGDGAGSVSYVGPCDADPAAWDNVVELPLAGLYADPVASPGGFGAAAPAGALPVEDPGLLSRTVRCVANADVPVRFDVSLVRPAQQGFFDVAVSFNDVFCSAKYDCSGRALLADATGARAPTHVLAFACTAGPSATRVTTLHLSDVVLDCGGAGSATVRPLAGPGNLCAAGDTDACSPAVVDPQQLLFQAAVYRGAEQLSGMDKVYWNVALGVRPLGVGVSCTLGATGTADDGALLGTPATIAAGHVYPYLRWSVGLDACPGSFAVTFDAADPVHVAYTEVGAATARGFAHRFHPVAGVVPGRVSFAATGSEQSFTVPAGWSEVEVKLWGAGGGGSSGDAGNPAQIGGGGGGFTRGRLAVTPGEALAVIVGGGGGAGGFGGGGGRSAIRRGAVELATAGGGGGSGWDGTHSSPRAGMGGGAGGGASGLASTVCVSVCYAGGGGGTQVAGGAAGGGYRAGCGGGSGASTAGTALAGGQGQGSSLNGVGGFGGGGAGYDVYCEGGGGGGGGGWFGGGGGGSSAMLSFGGGGGGGGSGYVGGLTAAASTAGGDSGDVRNAAGRSDPDWVAPVGVGGATGASGGAGRVVICYPDCATAP